MTEEMWIILAVAVIAIAVWVVFLWKTTQDPISHIPVDSTPMYLTSTFVAQYSFNEPNDPQFGIVKGYDKDRKQEILTEPQPHFKYLKGDLVKYQYIGVQTTNVKVIE